jgi:tetratricopeptide (TPR) repeat protein
MGKGWNIIKWTAFIVCTCIGSGSYAQGGLTLDLKKPGKYTERRLPSEKTGEKKFTIPRRFVQNTFTHFNYEFNARTKLKDIVDRAKTSFKEDYESLLPFYNYTLELTASSKGDLDSIIYKCTAGILLHDLRNDWIDNLYLLMGQAYYLRKDLDSAYLTFQFINFAFTPKDKSGYSAPIGSNADGNTVFSIANKERRNLLKKLLSKPPSRNDAFIWQIRTLLMQDETAEAAGLLEVLRSDPKFPARLKDELDEMNAFWYYTQQVWDKSAMHLEKALGRAENRQEKARWEYLIAQMYERSNKFDLANKYYERSIQHTLDPIMEVYARLSAIRMNKGDEKVLSNNIAALLKMARRDKYENYRDIIYYTAGQMELERNNPNAAIDLLLKSLKYNTNNNIVQRNKAFWQLGDIAFAKKDYQIAYNYYDSIALSNPPDPKMDSMVLRKSSLGAIVARLKVISHEDSLQQLVALPEKEREDVLRKLVKRLRKEKGLKDEGPISGGANPTQNNDNAPTNIFGDNKGTWYFNNPTLKSKGFSEFKSKWGNRPNLDNWRRLSAIGNSGNQPPAFDNFGNPIVPKDPNAPDPNAPADISYESLLASLPLKPEQLKISNDTLQQALFDLGVLYQDKLEDYREAITTYEDLNRRFPAQPNLEQTLFNLYYCYNKVGDRAKAAGVKQMLNSKFPNGKKTAYLNNPNAAADERKAGEAATRQYEEIYNMFIEGKFEQAIAEKKKADSIYPENTWNPQLLYIEAVYYIKQRQDSLAQIVLNRLIQSYAGTPLAEKATRLSEVLLKRKEIEAYLSKLEVKRDEDPALTVPGNNPAPARPPVAVQPPANNTPPVANNNPNQPPAPKPTPPLVPKPGADSVKVNPPKPTPPAPPAPTASYSHKPETPHAVLMVLDKVDPVYVSESQNAFNRFNRQNFYNQTYTLKSDTLGEKTLVLFTPFANAADAMTYMERVRRDAPNEIIPWLKKEKYNFYVITEANLEVLKAKKDLPAYLKFLQQNFPGKF